MGKLGKRKKQREASALAAAAAAPPPSQRRCYICLCGDDDGPDDADAGERVMGCGCACRGSAGLVHASCAAQAAQVQERRWYECLTCKQEYTGELGLRLARVKYRLCADMPEDEEERLGTAVDLTLKLWQSGELEEALQLGTDALRIARHVFGDEHELTLLAMARLAGVQNAAEDFAAALPLQTQVLAARRRVFGDDHIDTQTAVSDLAGTMTELNDYAKALPLYQESLRVLRRTLGSDDIRTVASR